MAKLECFTVDGMTLWFWPNDHTPPHFHAKRKGQWEVCVHFLEAATVNMFEVVWLKGKEVPRADVKLLEDLVSGHRAELLEEWERKVRSQ
jgi:hypothetical protein